MKTLTTFARFVVVLALLGNNQVFAQSEQSRQVSTFKRIEVGSAIELIIKQGNTQSVTVNTDAELQSKVITEVSGEILKLWMDAKNGEEWRNKKVSITVTTPNLSSLRASGASRVSSEATFKADNFDLNLSGASKVNLSLHVDQLDADMSGASVLDLSLTARTIKAELSGASKANITGDADQQNLGLSGASHYDAFKLASKRATVDASSASHANISVSEALQADLSSASHLNYRGSPKANQLKSSGAASIRKAG